MAKSGLLSYLMNIYLEAGSTALFGELWDSISALQRYNWKTGYMKPQSAPVCWEGRCSDTSVQGECVARMCAVLFREAQGQ